MKIILISVHIFRLFFDLWSLKSYGWIRAVPATFDNRVDNRKRSQIACENGCKWISDFANPFAKSQCLEPAPSTELALSYWIWYDNWYDKRTTDHQTFSMIYPTEICHDLQDQFFLSFYISFHCVYMKVFYGKTFEWFNNLTDVSKKSWNIFIKSEQTVLAKSMLFYEHLQH